MVYIDSLQWDNLGITHSKVKLRESPLWHPLSVQEWTTGPLNSKGQQSYNADGSSSTDFNKKTCWVLVIYNNQNQKYTTFWNAQVILWIWKFFRTFFGQHEVLCHLRITTNSWIKMEKNYIHASGPDYIMYAFYHALQSTSFWVSSSS